MLHSSGRWTVQLMAPFDIPSLGFLTNTGRLFELSLVSRFLVALQDCQMLYQVN